MGDPMWRLGTSINYLAEKIYSLNLERKIEIILADWGSELPIAKVIKLTKKSISIFKIVEVPKNSSKELQGDSPFAEVLALNAAARRSKGEFIARIDQDTLVSEKFLSRFFEAYEKPEKLNFTLANAYLFSARKQLLFSFVKEKPSIADLDKFICSYGSQIFPEELPHCFWASAVGILMAHKSIWYACGGYDERLKYYWYMDIDLGTRLIKKYPMVNIGKAFGYEFYHLEHFPLKKTDGTKGRASHRKKNPEWAKSFEKSELNPTGEDWGLSKLNLNFVTVDHSHDIAANTLVGKNRMSTKFFFEIHLINCLKWIVYKVKYLKFFYNKWLNNKKSAV